MQKDQSFIFTHIQYSMSQGRGSQALLLIMHFFLFIPNFLGTCTELRNILQDILGCKLPFWMVLSLCVLLKLVKAQHNPWKHAYLFLDKPNVTQNEYPNKCYSSSAFTICSILIVILSSPFCPGDVLVHIFWHILYIDLSSLKNVSKYLNITV